MVVTTIGMWDWTCVNPSGNKSCEVRHIDEEGAAAVVRDRAEPFEIDRARISRPTGDDHFGACAAARRSTSS